MAATTNWFTSEIQQMMFGFGDCRRPLHETAILVEEIVHQQMTQVLYQAMEVAQTRGSRFIGVEDLVFLLRKDPVKLGRLVRYMDAKDKKAAVLRGVGMDDEDAADLAEKPPKKRKKVIADFLASIDQTGELVAVLDEDRVDEVKHERLMRAEMQARGMDPQQYINFCQARQTNFSRRYKSQRFKDWLTSSLQLELKPNPPALEVLSYLAYETVAQVVDLALIVKQTRLLGTGDASEKQLPSSVFNYQDAWLVPSLASRAGPPSQPPQASTPPQGAAATTPGASAASGSGATGATTTSTTATTATSSSSSSSTSSTTAAAKSNKSKKRKKSGTAALPDALLMQAILPSDVQEAMRRFSTSFGPFASSQKVNTAFPPRKRLLCA